MSYVDLGDSRKPPILFIHGLGGSWRVWLENIVPMARDRRVIALDLPGFGTSPHRPELLRFDSYAEVVRDFCHLLELPPVVAIGNSFGGWICAEVARTSPNRVAALVLVDAAGIPPTRVEGIKALATLRMADRFVPWSCRNRERLMRRPATRRRVLAFAITRGDLLRPDLALHLLPEQHSPAFRPILETAFRTWNAAWCDSLQSVTAPTLIVWGELDRQLPLRHAAQWARHIPGAQVEVIGGAGHLPMVERPEVFHDYVSRFLAEVERSTA